jgi:hypothetical protein
MPRYFIRHRVGIWPTGGRKGSSSFLKKRTKKILPIKAPPPVGPFRPAAGRNEQKFFIFFKKEILPFLRQCISLYAG